MSGGSHDYLYSRMEGLYVGDMQDAELNELMADICELCHDLEWWQSGDYSEDAYRMTAAAFKKKWLYGSNGGGFSDTVARRDYRLCCGLIDEMSKVISRARSDISIVDPYRDSRGCGGSKRDSCEEFNAVLDSVSEEGYEKT